MIMSVPRSFVRGCVASLICACFFSASLSMPIDEQKDDCRISSLFVAQDMGNGVRVSHKTSHPESIQQSITLPDEHLPSICGTHFSRCNMIFVNNSAFPRVILVVPVQRGVALISVLYVANETLRFESYHVLEVSSAQVGETVCQVTTLYDFSDTTLGRDAPGVIGLCLNEVNIRRVSITINFNNISRSTLSRFPYDTPITLHSPESTKLSNFVSVTKNLPLCWQGILSTLTYYFEQSNFGLFDVISQEDYPEEYSVYYSDNKEYVCSAPRQLVHVSEQTLIMYCENMTAEVDMCEFSSGYVRNVKFYNESNGGLPYYCSPDMSSYVMVSGETVTFNNSTINCTVPLMSNESILFGDCITRLDGDEVFFAITTTIGNVYLLDPQQEDGVVLKVRNNRGVFAQHQVYNESILYTNGSSSVLYNTFCQSDPHRVIIDHPYHLALHSLGEGIQSCSCSRKIIVRDSTTDSEPGPGNEKFDGSLIAIIIVSVLLSIIVIVVLALGYMIYVFCKRSTKRLQRRPLHSSKKANGQFQSNTNNLEETSFNDLTSSKQQVKENGQRSGRVETREGEGNGGQEKVEEPAMIEDNVSAQTNGLVSANQSESLTVANLAEQSGDSSGTSCDQHEQSVQLDSGTGTYCQEKSWKNSEKSSVVLTSAQQNPYPAGVSVSQPGTRTTDDRAVASDENLTQSHCNGDHENGGMRTSDNFNSSLGNSGNHPPPTTTAVECSDNTYR